MDSDSCKASGLKQMRTQACSCWLCNVDRSVAGPHKWCFDLWMHHAGGSLPWGDLIYWRWSSHLYVHHFSLSDLSCPDSGSELVARWHLLFLFQLYKLRSLFSGTVQMNKSWFVSFFPASPSPFSSLPSSSSPWKQWPTVTRASHVAQLAKNPPAIQETWVWSLGCEDSLEKGKATHSSILAWEFHGLYSLWGGKDSDTTEQLSLHLPLLWSSFPKFIESLLSPVLLGTLFVAVTYICIFGFLFCSLVCCIF